MEEWTCRIVAMPEGVLGATDHPARVIYLARGLSQAQRRATLAHELQHVRTPTNTEHATDHDAVRRLIPLDRLINALRWCLDERELAGELWVDPATVQTRLAELTPEETRLIEEGLDDDHGC